MQCPACGTSNFAFAKSCECGHRFATAVPGEASPADPGHAAVPPLPSSPPSLPAADGLQLETAEFDTAGASVCATCASALGSSYFQVNGQSMCPRCCNWLRASLTGGSRTRRATKAVAAGFGAALAGALVYYGILALTGYEFGLIAVAVGFAVGKAVSWGSGGRGGWAYQTVAIALTYLSIAGAYVPVVMTEFRKAAARQASRETAPETAAAADAVTLPATGEGSGVDGELRPLWFWLPFAFAVAAASPFLQGFENILGIAIIAFGLYEAWKLNKRRVISITGPHSLAAAGVSAGS